MSGSHFPYPKHIWTPTGGWWFTPKNYKANLLVITGTAFVFSLTVFKLCQQIEHNPKEEYDEAVIDRWNAMAVKGTK